MTVSVIIPYYNAAKTLKNTVESVMSQRMMPLEIILVDNNSSDESPMIAKELSTQYPIIRLVHEERKGANYARNKGMRVAQGNWLQFLDADDELLPDKLLHQINLIQSKIKPSDMIVGEAYIRIVNPHGMIHQFVKPVPQDLIQGLILGTAGSTCSNLWNREFLNDIAGWDEDHVYLNDPFLVLKCVCHGAVIIIDNIPLTVIHQDYREASYSRPMTSEHLTALMDDVHSFYVELTDYIQMQESSNSDYLKLLRKRQFLTYCNFKLQYGEDFPEIIRHSKIRNNLNFHFISALKSYYYFLISYKVKSTGMLKYPSLLWNSVIHIRKFFSLFS
jgi:glycosyltransferase involved in cell wall biosynthesis